MRAIEEYYLSGSSSGNVRVYPKNNTNINYKNIVINELESYINKEYSLWDKYDEFINKSILNNILDLDLSKLNNKINIFNEMKKNIKFYTSEDFDKIILEINNIYKDIIKQIEENTNLRFEKDYILP